MAGLDGLLQKEDWPTEDEIETAFNSFIDEMEASVSMWLQENDLEIDQEYSAIVNTASDMAERGYIYADKESSTVSEKLKIRLNGIVNSLSAEQKETPMEVYRRKVIDQYEKFLSVIQSGH
ncbi:MAG: hypothetical protein J5750_08690 [Clostridiales bacterium]|nr:hypothetical protein [Clostridiales bacterium]